MTTDSAIAALCEAMACRALALGLFDARRPRIDEVLLHHGVSESALTQWCDQGPAGVDDRLLRDATRKGVAAGQAQTEDDSLFGAGGVLAVAAPHDLSKRRWWWMLLARQDGEFSEQDAAVASLLLREWEAGFKRPEEPGMGRLLLGHDDRLLAADLRIEDMLLSDPAAVTGLLGKIRPIVAQRWPKLDDREPRDVVVSVGGRRVWVEVHRGRSAPSESAVHWCLEIRPVDEGDLPAVGVLEDERIARSIAYLHAQFARSPSLAMTAKQIHMSPFHFHRLFSKHVGISPKQYLQRKQLQTAKWLLRSTRMPIGTIAQEAGFSSHGHFTSTFHRVVGLSPSQYREQGEGRGEGIEAEGIRQKG